MCKIVLILIVIILTYKECTTEPSFRPSQPEVEKPVLLDSYIPASMQVIAYLTDLMKYDVKPAETSPTTTTIRPTPYHRPGIYSPLNPLGAVAYFSKDTSYQEYIQRLKNPEGYSYFDRYRSPVEVEKEKMFRAIYFETLPSDLNLLGPGPSELIKQINKVEDYDFVDDDDRVQRFSENYDDSLLRQIIIGNKRPPPTKAYVILLTLYDQINKEAKKKQLNKFGGYALETLKVLAETAKGTSASQLHAVLGKLIETGGTRDQQIVSKINNLLKDLEMPNSYIIDALRYIPPLQFLI